MTSPDMPAPDMPVPEDKESATGHMHVRAAMLALSRSLEPLNPNQRARVLAANAILFEVEAETAEILNQ